MGFKSKFTDLFMNHEIIPGPSDMRYGTRVKVQVNGKETYGEFRGPSPDGSYSVLIDSDPKKLMAFDKVDLV